MLLSWTAHVSIHVSRQPIVGSSQVTLAFVVNFRAASTVSPTRPSCWPSRLRQPSPSPGLLRACVPAVDGVLFGSMVASELDRLVAGAGRTASFHIRSAGPGKLLVQQGLPQAIWLSRS